MSLLLTRTHATLVDRDGGAFWHLHVDVRCDSGQW